MRSIRRSLTLYQLGLLGLTLVVMWIVIDQITARSLEAREAAGAELIQAHYENRIREEKARIDQSLFEQANKLGSIVVRDYRARLNQVDPETWQSYRLTTEFALPLLFLSNPLCESAWVATRYEPGTIARPNLAMVQLLRMYFAALPLPEEFIRDLDDETRGTDYYQIHILVGAVLTGREWHSKSLAGRKLPFDPHELGNRAHPTRGADPGKPEPMSLIDWAFSDSRIDDEPVRKVLYKVPMFPGRATRGGPGGPIQPRSLTGAWLTWTAGLTSPWGVVGLPPTVQLQSALMPGSESGPRIYIQCARSQSAIDARLAQYTLDRDAELSHLAAEIREARTSLRFQVATIGLVAFLAIAIGGPLIVSTGLRPLGKLTDAVSRVSEKDFKLPHDGQGLSEELAPIHSRLTQTLDLLQRAFAREKQSVADISHELRTPIAALLATIDVALRKPRTPEHYRATLEECRLISRQLSQLVERIMTLASLDAGNDHTQFSRVDAADLASGCVAVIRPLAAANDIRVEMHLGPDLELVTDPGKLREVLMNLLHNAVEYNQPHGSIELTARRRGESIVFEVRDTGIGMTPEVKDRIFERFYRADASRHATGVHAGLGLAIVKEYVDRLKGTITVDSEPGVGSTFRLSLPALGPDDATEPTRDHSVGRVPAAAGI
jgi:signal transduction histidine kinase